MTPAPLEPEERFLMEGVSWAQYVLMRDMVTSAHVRMTYCEGRLELMRPSRDHERAKKLVARLLELYAFLTGIDLYSYGSTTFRKEAAKRGLEPDECYVFGRDLQDGVEGAPDLAVEIVVSPGMDKLDVYRGLGVKEVWLWTPDESPIYVLRGDRYETKAKSTFVPDLDVADLARLAWMRDQQEALRTFHASVTAREKSTKKKRR